MQIQKTIKEPGAQFDYTKEPIKATQLYTQHVSDSTGSLNIQRDFNPLIELELAWIDPEETIEKPPVVLSVDGRSVATLGNFSLLIGKAKARKSFFSIAYNAAYSIGEWGPMQGSEEREDMVILHFDTEQSRYDVQIMQKRYRSLIGNKARVKLMVYSIAEFNPGERLSIIDYAITTIPNISLVVIDGIRDLVKSINSEEESTTLASLLLKWTRSKERPHIHLMCVLHINKTDSNARGHLGTELINKAETVIEVTKTGPNDSVTTVTPKETKQREFEPFAFEIDPITSLPVICAMPVATEGRRSTDPYSMDQQAHFKILDVVFKLKPVYKYAELWQSIQAVWGKRGISFGVVRAKEYLTYYKSENWIQQNDEKYYTYTRAIF